MVQPTGKGRFLGREVGTAEWSHVRVVMVVPHQLTPPLGWLPSLGYPPSLALHCLVMVSRDHVRDGRGSTFTLTKRACYTKCGTRRRTHDLHGVTLVRVVASKKVAKDLVRVSMESIAASPSARRFLTVRRHTFLQSLFPELVIHCSLASCMEMNFDWLEKSQIYQNLMFVRWAVSNAPLFAVVHHCQENERWCTYDHSVHHTLLKFVETSQLSPGRLDFSQGETSRRVSCTCTQAMTM